MINRIIDFSVKTQVDRFMLVAVACIWGWWSMKHMSLDAIPDLSDTQVIIFSRWDRSPDIVEDQVTYPIVIAMVGAPKVKAVRGFSDFGYSYVYVIFEDGTDIYWARSRTQEYLSGGAAAAAGRRQDRDRTGCHASGLDLPVRPGGRIREAQPGRSAVLPGLVPQVLPEVGARAWPRWRPSAGSAKQYQVNVDPNRLQAYGISINRVVEAVRDGNYEVGGPADRVRRDGVQRSRAAAMSSPSRISRRSRLSASEYGHAHPHQGHRRRWSWGPDIRRGVADLDGKGEVVSGIVVMRHGQNALDVIERVKAKIKEIEPGLPAGVKIVPIYDRSDLILRAIDNLKSTVVEVLVTVALVVFLFLWHIPQRHHPRDHPARRHSALLHSLPDDGGHGQHHVSGRDRHRHRRHGGCGHRGGGTDPQEPGAVGARRPERRIIDPWSSGR